MVGLCQAVRRNKYPLGNCYSHAGSANWGSPFSGNWLLLSPFQSGLLEPWHIRQTAYCNGGPGRGAAFIYNQMARVVQAQPKL